MYKCQVCNAQSPPGQLLLRHAVMRTVPHVGKTSEGRPFDTVRTEIHRELAVCRDCLRSLTVGKTVDELVREFDEAGSVPSLPEPVVTLKAAAPVPLRGRTLSRGLTLVNSFRK